MLSWFHHWLWSCSAPFSIYLSAGEGTLSALPYRQLSFTCCWGLLSCTFCFWVLDWFQWNSSLEQHIWSELTERYDFIQPTVSLCAQNVALFCHKPVQSLQDCWLFNFQQNTITEFWQIDLSTHFWLHSFQGLKSIIHLYWEVTHAVVCIVWDGSSSWRVRGVWTELRNCYGFICTVPV